MMLTNMIRLQQSTKCIIPRRNSSISSKLVRKNFLDFFITENEHTFIRSSPVIPYCDNSIVFVNAGMNQFKNVFLGNNTAPSSRAANSQKCIRVGGKHNDYSIVGKDGYHHTFFEMLGNWSFGDYFKEHACSMAWRLLTEVYKINPNRLYITYFGGDKTLNLQPDLECKDIWRNLGVRPERLIPFGMKENFWEMGSTGPCGTCTEIHIDHLSDSPNSDRAKYVNADLPDLTELWNIVFIEYNRNTEGGITNLSQKHIDTGMGLERLVAFLNGSQSNYDSDLFTPLFHQIQKESKIESYSGAYNPKDTSYELDTAYRIIADHSRMITACLADGMFPDQNHKLRRILRNTFNVSEKFFKDSRILLHLVPVVADILGDTYPEMPSKQFQTKQIIEHELELYKQHCTNLEGDTKTLLLKNPHLNQLDILNCSGFTAGYKEIEKFKINLNTTSKPLLPGDIIFKLYDTYGFDKDFIYKLADIENFELDIEGFKSNLLVAKNRTKDIFTVSQSLGENDVYLGIAEIAEKDKIPLTINEQKYDYVYNSKKKCFDVPTIKAQIKAIYSEQEAVPKATTNGKIYHVIFDNSNFYHEAGGQEHDIGNFIIENHGNSLPVEFVIKNAVYKNGYLIHSGFMKNESDCINIGENGVLRINNLRRTRNISNHTATHLLNSVIRNITKAPSYQKSSLVTANLLKFDLVCYGFKLEKTHISEAENTIRDIVKTAKIPIRTKIIDAQELLRSDNITLIPGETYPDNNLRLVEICNDKFISKELCCGTHATNTSDLIDYCIINVKPTGRNSYVFTAVTGDKAAEAHSNGAEILNDILKITSEVETTKNKIENYENRIHRFKSIISQKSEHEVLIPYVIRLECIELLNYLNQQLKDTSRENLRKLIEIEMESVLLQKPKESHKFILHFLECSSLMETVSLQKATRCCVDRPIMILSLTESLIKARCCVPKDFINSNFSAKSWIDTVAKIFNGNVSAPRGQKIEEVCNMKPKKVTSSIFEEQLEMACKAATNYANQNI